MARHCATRASTSIAKLEQLKTLALSRAAGTDCAARCAALHSPNMALGVVADRA